MNGIGWLVGEVCFIRTLWCVTPVAKAFSYKPHVVAARLLSVPE